MAQTPSNANPYFEFSTNYLSSYQKNMYAETIQMFGYNCQYIPIDFVEGDINYVFGEVNKVSYTQTFSMRMYIENYDELHQAFNNFIKYGILLLPESLECSISKQDYESIVTKTVDEENNVIPPKTGDLIYFQIHDESVLFETTQINFLYDSYYSFPIRLYNYNATVTFDTGNDDIDSVDGSDTIDINQNQKIEDAYDEFQDPTKRHNIWGSY